MSLVRMLAVETHDETHCYDGTVIYDVNERLERFTVIQVEYRHVGTTSEIAEPIIIRTYHLSEVKHYEYETVDINTLKRGIRNGRYLTTFSNIEV